MPSPINDLTLESPLERGLEEFLRSLAEDPPPAGLLMLLLPANAKENKSYCLQIQSKLAK